MTWDEFKKSLSLEAPPDLSPYQTALWFDGKGDWHQAHDIIQEIDDAQSAWIHAYLHRKEGDQWNANYWYHRAGKEMPLVSLDEEWELLCQSFFRVGLKDR